MSAAHSPATAPSASSASPPAASRPLALASGTTRSTGSRARASATATTSTTRTRAGQQRDGARGRRSTAPSIAASAAQQHAPRPAPAPAFLTGPPPRAGRAAARRSGSAAARPSKLWRGGGEVVAHSSVCAVPRVGARPARAAQRDSAMLTRKTSDRQRDDEGADGRDRCSASPSRRPAVVGHAARHAVVAEHEHREEGQVRARPRTARSAARPSRSRSRRPVTFGHQ